ncbi:MAG: hypothetical protein RLZZ450_841 [Pseudomonadota bacterium]
MSSSQVEREAHELLKKAKAIRAQEAKVARDDARYRQCLLGIALQQEMIADPVLMARFHAVMGRFCTRPRDRELFGFAGASGDFATLVRADVAGKKRNKEAGEAAEAAPAQTSNTGARERAGGVVAPSSSPAGVSATGGRARAAEGAAVGGTAGSTAPTRGVDAGLAVGGPRASVAPSPAAAGASASMHAASAQGGAG